MIQDEPLLTLGVTKPQRVGKAGQLIKRWQEPPPGELTYRGKT